MNYTLQSTLNGKYISELFTDNHFEMFRANNKQVAYEWSNLQAIHIMRDKIKCCIVVRIGESNNG